MDKDQSAYLTLMQPRYAICTVCSSPAVPQLSSLVAIQPYSSGRNRFTTRNTLILNVMSQATSATNKTDTRLDCE